MSSRILMVWTTNVYRSPMAEVTVRSYSDDRRIDARVSSVDIIETDLSVGPDPAQVMADTLQSLVSAVAGLVPWHGM